MTAPVAFAERELVTEAEIDDVSVGVSVEAVEGDADSEEYAESDGCAEGVVSSDSRDVRDGVEERVAVFVGADDSEASELLVLIEVGVVLNELRAEALRLPVVVPERVSTTETDADEVPDEEPVEAVVEVPEGLTTLDTLAELESVD